MIGPTHQTLSDTLWADAEILFGLARAPMLSALRQLLDRSNSIPTGQFTHPDLGTFTFTLTRSVGGRGEP